MFTGGGMIGGQIFSVSVHKLFLGLYFNGFGIGLGS